MQQGTPDLKTKPTKTTGHLTIVPDVSSWPPLG